MGVALRCPDHMVTLALLEAFGAPLVGPSANPSGFVSPTTADHVRHSLGAGVYVLDGGPCRAGIESTVVSLMDPARPRILRPGLVTRSDVERALGRAVDAAEPGAVAHGNEGSPGMTPAHYAPHAPAELLPADKLRARLEEFRSGPPMAVLAIALRDVKPPHVAIEMPADPEAYAALIYAALREADSAGPSRILIEFPPVPRNDREWDLWNAVLDRLYRAVAGGAVAGS